MGSKDMFSVCGDGLSRGSLLCDREISVDDWTP